MLKIVICDDDPVFVGELSRKLHVFIGSEEYGISTYASAEKMAEAAAKGAAPDILLMDIELGGEDGIELVKKLFTGTGTQVIYVTSYVEYCTKVYESEHIYFLLKPICDADLRKALQKAHDNLIDRSKKISFETKTGTLCFSAGDILFFESSYRKLTVHTTEGASSFYGSIADVLEKTDGRFVQCHKSFLVNLQRITAMEGDAFILDDGSAVPISRGMRDKTRQVFFKYLGTQ